MNADRRLCLPSHLNKIYPLATSILVIFILVIEAKRLFFLIFIIHYFTFYTEIDDRATEKLKKSKKMNSVKFV